MDVENYLKRIGKEFPFLKWQKFKEVDTGADFKILLLDWRYVVRIPRTSEYQDVLNSELEFLRSTGNLLAGKVDTRIPKLLYLAEDNAYAVYEFIEGEPLSEAFGKRKLTKVVLELSNFFKAFHSLGRLGVTPSSYLENSIMQLSRTWKQDIGNYLSITERANLTNQFSWYVAKLRSGEIEQQLVHGDISLGNLLWNDKKQELGILDFSDRDISDPCYDFSELYELGTAFVVLVLKNCPSLNSQEYLKRSRFYYELRPLINLSNLSKNKAVGLSTEEVNRFLKNYRKRVEVVV